MSRSAREVALRAWALLCLAAAAAGQIITELTPDTPNISSVEHSAYAYFKVALAGQTKDLSVTVTPFSVDMDPDLYASLTNPYPQSGNASHAASGFGEDTITIFYTEYHGSEYAYFSVYGWRRADFAITANFQGVISLQDGVPQADSLHYEQQHQFKFVLHTAPQSITSVSILATPTIGSPTLAVATTQGGPTIWSSYGAQSVFIRQSDPGWPTTGHTFWITVTGSGTMNNYTLRASSNIVPMTLTDGQQVVDQIDTGEYEYFDFTVVPSGCQLTISVTALSGDPDIYVTRNSSSPPGPKNNERHSVNFGTDQVSYDIAEPAVYHIGVYSFINSTFYILAKTTCTTHKSYTDVGDGVPVAAFLQQGTMQYYRLQVSTVEYDVSVAATVEFGDPDVYIVAIPRSAWPLPDEAWPVPTNRSTWSWAANRYGSDMITIRRTDRNFCENCIYFAGVYAFTNTSYTLTMSTGTVTMQLGVPVRDDLPSNSYEYFMLIVDSAGALSITVTELGQGDPDLFVSRAVRQPNSSSFQWHSERFGDDTITILPSDAHSCTADEIHRRACVYFVSVFASDNSTFSLVASINQPTQLSDGVPQYSSAVLPSWKYFELRTLCPEHAEVTISYQVLSGRLVAYVGTDMWPDGSRASYHWSTSWWSSLHSIQIARDDPYRCLDATTCSYKIGVYAQANTSFLMTGFTNCVARSLSNGKPVQSHLERGKSDTFQFTLEQSNNNVSFVVTPLSGDPDLFITCPPGVDARCRGIYIPPNQTNYDISARKFGADIVDFPNAALGTYYITVFAFQNTTFTLMAIATSATANDAVTLYSGQPQAGTVFVNSYKHYTFELFGEHSVVFNLDQAYGSTVLLVNANAEMNVFPTIGNADYQSTTGRLELDSADEGIYTISVFGSSTSGYTISATFDNEPTQLIGGSSVLGGAGRGQYVYYYLEVDSFEDDITITVTPLSGDPDLYVSTTNHTPSAADNQWAGVAYRDDSVVITRFDTHYCLPSSSSTSCVYYIAVYGYSNCRYSISASFTSSQSLQIGVPVSGTVSVHTMQFYTFEVSDANSDISIAVTARDGNVNLFVAVNYEPSQTNYTWAQQGWFSGDVLTLRHADAGFCASSPSGAPCVYYLGVYGISASNYTLTVSSGAEATTLADGVPVRAHLEAGTYGYYQFALAGVGHELDITLTALSGDPDIIMSNDTVCARPRFGMLCPHVWTSGQAGSDSLTVVSAAPGHYYIGVYAFTNTTFVISAYSRDPAGDSVINLVNGQPQSGTVDQRTYKYYQIHASDGSPLSITLSVSVGDPDLYVTYSPDNVDPVMPTVSHHNWASTAAGGDFISIPTTQPGVYTIGVYGFTSATYTILAAFAGNMPITLSSGVPFLRNTPSGSYEHFVFNVDRLDEELTITVTPFSGDPDLYMATDMFPNGTHYTWSATSYQADSITVPHTRLTLGTYYISVYSWGWNSSYSIVASFSNTTDLQDGVPQMGHVEREAAQYYSFHVSHSNLQPPQTIGFTVTQRQGVAYLYVSTRDYPVANDPNSYQWSSRRYASDQLVRITPSDAQYDPTATRYYVMVYGYQPANYTVTATTGTVSVRLFSGVSQNMWVKTGENAVFYYTVDSVADISVSVTPFNGDPDLYLAFGYEPNTTHYQRRSLNWGEDHITVAHDDAIFQQTTLFLAVHAFVNTTFQIVLTATPVGHNQTIDLVNGVPQSGSLPTRGKIYYRFTSPSTSKDVTITVTPTSGDPDLYVNANGQQPSTSSFQYWSSSTGLDQVVVPASACQACTVDILVYGFSATYYTVMASLAATSMQLQDGVGVSGSLGLREYAYYSIYVEQQGQLSIDVLTLSGDPDLYVSRSNHFPNASSWEWRRTNFGSDHLVISPAAPGFYYIGIMAFLRNTSYTVVATTQGSIKRLDEAKAQSSSLIQGNHDLYRFTVADINATRDITITITAADNGIATVYVTNNGTQLPSEDMYQWATGTEGRGTLIIPYEEMDCIAGLNCTFFVAVYAPFDDVSYQIVWAGESAFVELGTRTPFQGHVHLGAERNFVVEVTNGDDDVSVMVELYSGQVDMYVSNIEPVEGQPPTSRWPVKSSSNVMYVTIPAPLPVGKYYVSLVGVTDAAFSILVTGSETLLVDGKGQVAQTRANGNHFYFGVAPSQTSDLTFYLNDDTDGMSFGLSFHLYFATLDNDSPDTVDPPTPASYEWTVDMNAGDQFYTLAETDEHFCTGCTIFVGVYPKGSTPVGQLYTIQIASANSLKVLSDGKVQPGRVEMAAYSYYQMPVMQTQNFTIVLEPCTGEVDLYTSFDGLPTATNHGPPSMQSTKHNAPDIVYVERSLLDPIYVGVYGYRGSIPPQYQIHSVIKTSERPYTVPAIDNPVLTLSNPGANQIEISFDVATAPTPHISYEVYLAQKTDPSDVVMYTHCGLEQPQVRRAATFSSDEHTTTMRGIIDIDDNAPAGTEYILNVRAREEATGAINLYSPSSIRTAAPPGGGGGVPIAWFLGIGIPVFIVTLAIIIYLCVRNRKLTKELEVEMHDVPKAAVRKAVNGPPSAQDEDVRPNQQTKAYSRLLTEEEDSESTEYAPPDF